MEEDQDISGVEEHLLGPGADAELEGIGRARGVTFFRPQAAAAKAFASRKAQAAVKGNVLSRAQKIFVAKFGELPSEERKGFQSGAMQIGDGDFYVRTEVTGTGIQTLLDESSTKRTGKTNINKGALPIGTNLLVSRIRMAYATHATETDSAALLYGSEGSNLQAAFGNGILRIKVGEIIAFEGRVSKLFSDGQNGLVPNNIEAHSEYLSWKVHS